jgi:hypothetical protein
MDEDGEKVFYCVFNRMRVRGLQFYDYAKGLKEGERGRWLETGRLCCQAFSRHSLAELLTTGFWW